MPPSSSTLWCLVGLFSLARQPFAQEALRASLAGEAAAEARRRQVESRPYTIKWGDFRLLVTPSLETDWNSNVNISKSEKEDDIIIKPLLTLQASYPVTVNNLLNVKIGFGYDKYIDHDELSSWRLDTGSEIAFDMFVKDWRFDLHDRFSYTQDSARQADVAGTGEYGEFSNTAGLSATWDYGDLISTFGYDHQNEISTTDQFQYTDHASELIFARSGLKVHPQLTTGVEGSVAFTAYDEKVLNDNTSYSAGIYGDWAPGKYVRIKPRAGYTFYDFQQTSRLVAAMDQSGWYFDVTASHAVTDSITYDLRGGREIRLGTQADITEAWIASAGISWQAMRQVTVRAAFSYEHGTQGVSGAVRPDNPLVVRSEDYDWYSGNLSVDYAVLKKLTTSLFFRPTFRSSSNEERSYDQQVVGIRLAYQLQ